MPAGSTIHSIVAARHTVTARPQTGLAVLLEATPWPIVKLALDNSWAGRVAILPAIVAEPASATEPETDWAAGTGSAVGGQTALEGGTSRAVAEETETHSEVAPGVLADTTDPAPAPTAAVAPPAWDPAGEGPEAEAGVAAVAGADERRLSRKVMGCTEMKQTRGNRNLKLLWAGVLIACVLFLCALVL